MAAKDILSLYIERNEEAITATQNKYNREIKAVVNHITDNFEDTEECMNDTYMALWKSVHIIRPVHFRNYIIEIAKRNAYSILRKKLAQKRKTILIELFDAECVAGVDIICDIEYKEVASCVMDFLHEQEEFNRKVFMMHYFKTTPLAVIAAIYGKNVAQIKMMLYRMRQKLKNYLLEEEIHL